MPRLLVKTLFLLAALAGLAALFLQTVRQTASEPYTVDAALLGSWTVTVEGPADPLGAMLSLRPAPELPMQLSQQIFRRHAESMLSPAVRSIPLVLREEYDAAIAGVLTPGELSALAEEAGVASGGLEPVCMAEHRPDRSQQPGRIFFVLFDSTAFARFRDDLAATLEARGGSPAPFDPAALSPLLVVAASDRTFEAWLPRRADASACVAPIERE